MSQVKISYKKIKNPPALLWFIPKPMENADRPDLSVFPQNILFVEKGVIKPPFRIAVYEPDLNTLVNTDKDSSLCYFNEQNGDFWLRLKFSRFNNAYEADKYFKDRLIGSAYGVSWDRFFMQLGILGIALDENSYLNE